MAGKYGGFDADAFRDGISLAFTMGQAPELDDELATPQVSFHFPTQLVYTGPVDGDGVPFDPDSTVQRVVPTPVTVPCGIEYVNAGDDPTPFGDVIATRVKISLLDEDYASVKDASYVVIGGERYNYHHSEIPRGLFDVGIYTLIFQAVNDL